MSEKSRRKAFTTITNFGFYQNLVEDAGSGETVWSINKNVEIGDVVYLYVCAPKSAIVATAVIADFPYLDEEVNSPFFGSYFAQMIELKMLNISITRKQLEWEFPHWRYWTQPRNSIQIPYNFALRLESWVQEIGYQENNRRNHCK